MWPKIRAIPGLRLVHRWVQGHICAKTDTGYFKVIIGLLKEDFEAWAAADFYPEHEYMTHMSGSELIDDARRPGAPRSFVLSSRGAPRRAFWCLW